MNTQKGNDKKMSMNAQNVHLLYSLQYVKAIEKTVKV